MTRGFRLSEELKTRWQGLVETGDACPRPEQIRRFVAFSEQLVQDSDCESAFAALTSPEAVRWPKLLAALASGDIRAVGLAPEFELIMLTALFHLSRGYRVMVFTGLPIAPGRVRLVDRVFSQVLGIQVTQAGHVFGKPRSTERDLAEGQLVLADFALLFNAFNRNPAWLTGGRVVALFCEADLCLYDARLGLFDHGVLRAVAAIFRSTGKKAPWKEQKNILDLKTLLSGFSEVGGVASYMAANVAAELNRTYAGVLAGRVRGYTGTALSALCFQTSEEKVAALLKDINTAAGDCLVFYVNDPIRHALQVELKKRGQDTVAITNPRDLNTFLTMTGASKRVGLYRGVPTMLSPVADSRPEMNVFVAEHYLMAHQHQKLCAFIARDVRVRRRACIYFSLQDEIFSVYAAENRFQGAFDLIAFTERYDKWRQVRRVMARSIMRKIHSLRRACLDEEYPIFTLVHSGPGMSTPEQKGSGKRHFGARLEGACFCGSGKPFKECHGRPRGQDDGKQT